MIDLLDMCNFGMSVQDQPFHVFLGLFKVEHAFGYLKFHLQAGRPLHQGRKIYGIKEIFFIRGGKVPLVTHTKGYIFMSVHGVQIHESKKAPLNPPAQVIKAITH